MSTAVSTEHQTRRRAATSSTAHPLVSSKIRRVLAKTGCALAVLGAIVGLASLFQPSPEPCFVGLCLSPTPADWTLRDTVAANDFAALRDGKYFNKVHSLSAGPATDQLLASQLSLLARVPALQRVVLYVVGTGFVDPHGRLQIAINGTSRTDTISLRDILTDLKDCRARGKFVILDVAPPPAEFPWDTTPTEIAQQIQQELQAVPDARRIVLSAYGPGERPLTSEHWQRSGLGHYFEQALRGRADGAIDGKTDGCVTAREIAVYVQANVERWASITQGETQRPVVTGDGPDFPLMTIAMRDRSALADTTATTDEVVYPKWLAAGWSEREKHWKRGDFRLHPRTFRRLETALSRLEQQWRGGRDPEAIRADVNVQLEHFRSALRDAEAALPTAAPYSIGQLDGEVDEAATKVRVELQQLLSDIETKTQALPLEAANVTKQALSKSFQDKTKSVPDDAFVLAAIQELESVDEPSPQLIVLLNELISHRHPQPRFVETLLLSRMANLAKASPEEFDIDLVRQSLRIASLQAKVSGTNRSFPWTANERRSAWQAQHNGEYLLFRPGYGPRTETAAQLQAAESEFERITQTSDTLKHAYETLDVACLRLPLIYQLLNEQGHDKRVWFDAVEAADRLSQELTPEPARIAQRLDVIATHARDLRDLLQTLEAPVSVEYIGDLLTRAKQQQKLLPTRREISAALRWHGLSAEQRQALGETKFAIDCATYVELLDDSKKTSTNDVIERQLVANPFDLESLRASIALLQVGGFHNSKPSTDDQGVTIIQVRQIVEKLVNDGPADDSVAARAKLGRVLPLRRHIAWLDDEKKNPYVALERELRRRHLSWLASEFAYRAHDDTPELNAELSRRFAAIAAPQTDQFLQVLSDDQVARPSQTHPEVQVEVTWRIAGNDEKNDMPTSVRVIQPHHAFPVKTTKLPHGVELTFAWSQGDAGAAQRGAVVQVEAVGRTWHCPLTFEATPWASSLQLLSATDEDEPGALTTKLRLRPSDAAQPYFLSVRNPTNHEANITVEIPGVCSVPVSLAPQSVTPIKFVPPPKPAAPNAAFDRILPLRIRDAKTGEVLTERDIPLEILSPSQYVRVVESRFVPGEDGDNRLQITLQSNNMPPGPTCLVAMEVTNATVPGLAGILGGTLQGELPGAGESLILDATGLQLIDGYSPRAEFSLTIDGVPQAMAFSATLPRRGDPTTPQQVARPSIAIQAKSLALAGAYSIHTHILQAPLDATIHLRIGKVSAGGFAPQLHQHVTGPRRQRVQVVPQKDGSLTLQVALEDWSFDFDTSGLVGPRVVVADIVDAQGRTLATAQQSVVFDDSPAELATCTGAGEMLVNQPIAVNITAADSLSGIDDVSVFTGRPVDGKIPPGVKAVEAEYHSDTQQWVANLPPQKLAGPLDVTAVVVNGVGLAKNVTTRLRVLDSLPQATGVVQGTVQEGPRPQPRLTVQLLDDKNAVVASTRTDAQGGFEFHIRPGKYAVHAVKPASGRQATQPVAVQAGKPVQVNLELKL